MVSQDIQQRREQYLQIMHDHGTKPREQIIESVRETQAKLLDIFSSTSDEQASRKPADDEWSLHELALHTVFTERLIAKLIHHAARGNAPPAEDLEGAGLGMMPQGDSRSYEEVINDLRRVNEDLLDAVRGLPEEPDMEMKPPHPFFGPLNCLEWTGFQRVHDTDHIQHAEKILAATRA